MANLKNYFETELASMETRITDAYGFSTAIIVKDFIDSFYYAQDIAYIDEAFYDFADENTAINDYYLYDWLTADNASEKYIRKVLNCGIPANSDVSLLSIIKTAMYQEIYDALTFSFHNGLKECLTAKYLMYMGFTGINENVLEYMTEHLEQYDYISFGELFLKGITDNDYITFEEFLNALTDNTCSEDNCESKCA